MPPFAAQPATGTRPAAWRPIARKARPLPITARISGARCWSTSTPWAAARRRTRRSWFIVSTGKSVPGRNTAAPMRAFRREKRSISSSHTAGRSAGSAAASDLVDGKAAAGGNAHDVRGEHVRDARIELRAGENRYDRHARPRSLPEDATILIRRLPRQDVDQSSRPFRRAAAHRAGPPARAELLAQSLRQRR